MYFLPPVIEPSSKGPDAHCREGRRVSSLTGKTPAPENQNMEFQVTVTPAGGTVDGEYL